MGEKPILYSPTYGILSYELACLGLVTHYKLVETGSRTFCQHVRSRHRLGTEDFVVDIFPFLGCWDWLTTDGPEIVSRCVVRDPRIGHPKCTIFTPGWAP